MTAHKHAITGEMPGLEGMGPLRTGIMIIVVAVLALIAIAAMARSIDAAHGGVVVEAPQR